MAQPMPIVLPDIGGFSNVTVIEILVKPGDIVEAEQSILTLESDKASLEIPCPAAGQVTEVLIKVGDTISKGHPLMLLQTSEAQTTASQAPEPPTEAPAAPVIERLPGEKRTSAPPISMPTTPGHHKPHASPAIRRFARELGVDLSLVHGSGNKGRVTREDVQNHVKRALAHPQNAAATPSAGTFALPAMPPVNFSQFGPVQEQPLGRIRKLSGAHLHRCWLTIPHVTQFSEADITDLEAFRKAQQGDPKTKLTLLPFLLRACARALRDLPDFNSSLSTDGEQLILKDYVHIGVAVDTPRGLMVPVLRDVDRKGLLPLAEELQVLSAKAREGRLTPSDLQGGCFTISSLGGIGGTAFTPVVNHPEVAILGVSRASMKPTWDGQTFVPRLMLPLSLAYDHRVIDGAAGARFSARLCQLLGDIRQLLL